LESEEHGMGNKSCDLQQFLALKDSSDHE
jgi:hypothetical protein